MTQDAMREATRLTREGRLKEAMALLQRLLTGRAVEPGRKDGEGGAILDLSPPAPGQVSWSLDQEKSDSGVEQDIIAQRAAPVPEAPGLRSRLRGLRRRPAADPIAAGARFEMRRYANASGERRYKLYVPSSYRGDPVPLLLMLHGCTQNPDDIAAGTRMNTLAEERGLIVAYPEQPRGANANLCWNWFEEAHQHRDAGEPALLAGLIRRVMGEFAVNRDRVFVAGMSAGGAAAAVLGAVYPDLFAGVGVHSGLARGAASDLPSALSAMKGGGRAPTLAAHAGRLARAIVIHGDRDRTVSHANADAVVAQFTAGFGTATREEERAASSGGLDYTRVRLLGRDGRAHLEHWTVHGAGHAWCGGSRAGSYVDPRGPDASRAMLRFFLDE